MSDRALFIGHGTGNVHHIRANAVGLEVVLDDKMTLGPFASRGIRGKKEHGDGDSCYEDEGHDE